MTVGLSSELKQLLEQAAEEDATTMTNVFRTAIALFIEARKAKKSGKHIGVVDDASKLDTEWIGIL